MAPYIPPEIMHRIVGNLMYGPKLDIFTTRKTDMSIMGKGIAHEAPLYATVSRTWQEIIERATFRRLRLDLQRLKRWGSIMTSRRRSYVTMLLLDIVLPRYFDASWGQVETVEEQRQNNIITTATIKEFIEQLGSWKKEDMPVGHELGLWMQAYSPSDEGHWTPDEWKDRRAWPRPKWPQIYEKRYENSVLELTDLDTSALPQISAITYVKNNELPGRHVAPAVVCALIGSLRDVRNAACLGWEDPTEFSERRHRIRADYARVVRGVMALPEKMAFSHNLKKATFESHSAQPPVFTPRGTDDQLSIGLRRLSQRAKRLVFGGVIIGDEFFWPSGLDSSTDNDEPPHWPELWHFTVGLALSTPDGRWRFDFAEPESPSASDGSNESGDSDLEQPTRLRIQANPDLLNSFYRSAARAAMEMPRLSFMQLIFNGWNFQGVNFHTFIYEVKESKARATWYSYPPFQPDEDVMRCWEEVGVKYHNTTTELSFSARRPSRR